MPSHIRWLYLGLLALAISGLYSVLLVLLRTPGFAGLIQNPEIFKTTLVIHVNLSVFVWLLSSIAALWATRINKQHSYWSNYCNYIAFIGVFAMSVAPLVSDSNPILNNYIPMLENWCFIAGVVIFGCSIACMALIVIFGSMAQRKHDILSIANLGSAIILVIAYICFILSYVALDRLQYPLDLHFYYETIFWSFGHILQFVYVQGVMIVWLILSKADLSKNKLYQYIFILNTLLGISGLYGHIAFEIDSLEFTEFFTMHMKYCGGIAPTLLLLLMICQKRHHHERVQAKRSDPVRLRRIHNSWDSDVVRLRLTTTPRLLGMTYLNPALLTSLLLFFFGGGLGALISEVNVTIPAHYHGSIVGVSIAFMGFCYKELDINNKWSRVQPWVYAMGQMMHITALAWSGGYGVLRKTPHAELSSAAKISMGFMGLGGLVAIIGGLMFVCICLRHSFKATYD